MQDVISTIRTMCQRFPCQPKYLILPAFRMKGQVMKYINDSEINAVNLHVISAGSLAMEWAQADVLERGAKILSYNDVADLVGEILASLKASGKLEFFGDSLITPGLNRVISGCILDLKKNGISQGLIKLDRLPNLKKRSDLELIYSQYEALLQQKNYLDQADLIEIAAHNLEHGKVSCSACYILPGTRLSVMERRMLEKLWPSNETMPSDEDDLPPVDFSKKNISFLRAYGEYNEAKEVIRNIVLHGTPLDTIVVAVATEEPYAQLFYQLFQSYLPGSGNTNVRSEIPITFGTGLPVTFTNPGKLALALLKWIKFGYRAHDLISIFSSGAVRIGIEDEEETQSSWRNAIISVIKNSNLKWQRQTYHKTFEDHKLYLQRKLEESAASPYLQARYQHRIKALEWLDETLEQDFFACLPELDSQGKVDADLLYRGVGEIIGKQKRINDKMDAAGLESVLGEMKGSLKTEKVPVGEAVDILVDRIKQIRTFVENPTPGKIHITSYRNAAWVNRENVYLMGLHAGRFPGQAVEDPILLDEERVAVGEGYLITSQQRIQEHIRQMNRFLQSIQGRLVLSYPWFDTVDNREQYPATLYYEAMDAVKAAHGSFEEKNAGFLIPDQDSRIDEQDWWIGLSAEQGALGKGRVLRNLKQFHPDLYRIHAEADTSHQSPGMVRVALPELADPRKMDRIQSASVLGDYLFCPYLYLMKSVMHLKEFKEKEFDTIGWLDPLESGSLHHEILETFYRKALDQPDLLKDVELAGKLMIEIAEEAIQRYEREKPTASAFYTAQKKKDILKDLLIFAEEAVEADWKYQPLLMEYRFGTEGDLILELADGEKISITGAIDRIDQIRGTKKLRIVDYKTGSDFSYKVLSDSSAPVVNHKTMQPFLYYMALNRLSETSPELKGLGPVSEASYHFVSSKGDYQNITIEFGPDSERQFLSGLGNMFDDMAAGAFPMTQAMKTERDGRIRYSLAEIAKNCKFCGYQEICSQSVADFLAQTGGLIAVSDEDEEEEA